MPRNNSEKYPGRNARFSELLRWHMHNGTNLPVTQLDEWPYNFFAEAVGVHPQTVYNWLRNKKLPSPSNYEKIERLLFGDDRDLAEYKQDLSQAYNEHIYEFREIAEPRLVTFDDRRIIPPKAPKQVAVTGLDGLRFISNSVPISSGHTILSLSVNVSNISNKIWPLDKLSEIEEAGENFYFAEGIDDFIYHIINSIDQDKFMISNDVMLSIDNDDSILYFGSVKPVKTEQIAKLPALIKSFSSMSNKQFRVGLFRLSTTIVVMTVISGSGAALGWAVTSKLKDIASKAIIELSRN